MAEKTTAEIEIQVDTRRAESALKDLTGDIKQVEAATDSLNRTNKDAAGSWGKVSDAQKVAGREMGMRVNEVSELALGFGALSPKLRETALGFAMMGNSAVTLGATMGPLGVGIAAVATGLPLLIKALQDTEEAADGAADATHGFMVTLEDSERALQSWLDMWEQQQRVMSGQGGVTETLAAILDLQTEIGDTQRALNRAWESEDFLGAQDLAEQLGRQQEQLAVLQGGLSSAQERERGRDRPTRERGRRGRGGPSEPTLDDLMAQAGGRRSFAEGLGGGEEDPLEFLDEWGATASSTFTQTEKDIERMTEATKGFTGALKESNDVAIGSFEGIAAAGLESISAIAEHFGAAQGPIELLKGGIQVAEAFGSYPDVAGIIAHSTSAALHFARAAELGAGGGQSVPSPGQIMGGPARADGGPGGGGGDRGGAPITINYNSPVPEALIGLHQRRSERAAQRRYGSTRGG